MEWPKDIFIKCSLSLGCLLLNAALVSAQVRGTISVSQSRTTVVPVRQNQYADLELKLRVFIPSGAVNFWLDFLNRDKSLRSSYIFGGDDRKFSYDQGSSRIEKKVVVTLDPKRPPRVSLPQPDYPVTTAIYLESQGEKAPSENLRWWWSLKPGEKNIVAKPKVTQYVPDETEVASQDRVVSVSFKIGGIGNPYFNLLNLFPDCKQCYPDPDGEITVMLYQCGDKVFYKVTGQHDGFPAYELYLEKKPIYQFIPYKEESPGTLGALFSFARESVEVKWTLLDDSLSPPHGSVYKFEIGDGSREADQEISVETGDKITVSTEGEFDFGGVIGKGNPNGAYSYPYSEGSMDICHLYPRATFGTLLGKIVNRQLGEKLYELGNAEGNFIIGSNKTFTANKSGELILFVNDACVRDNIGSFYGCAVVLTGK